MKINNVTKHGLRIVKVGDDDQIKNVIPKGFNYYGPGDNEQMPLTGYEIRYADTSGWREVSLYCPRKFKPTDLYIWKPLTK